MLTTIDVSESGPLACICHGDCWSNNFLFHYNDAGVANDNRIVDWQILTPENPGRDIYEFLTTSTSPEIRKECSSELLDHYVTTFMSALSKLGLCLEEEGFTREFLTGEIKKKLLFGLFAGLTWLPGIMDQSMTSDIEKKGKKEDPVQCVKDADDTDVFTDAQKALTLDSILSNKLLCHHIINLVKDFKEVLE